MVIVSCPECEQPINIDADPEIGQRVTCPSCQTDLDVTWLFPIRLDYPEPKEPTRTGLLGRLE